MVMIQAATPNARYKEYIEKYSELAIAEQVRYGIPASITIAQALLESSAGSSRLAVFGNNHFGVKCGRDWTGKTILEDDDHPQDCFRKYPKVIDSFEDHSLFLKRPRYASLFNYDITDYKAWANGLSRAGYATDPNYAGKLISIIELYELHRLDTVTTYLPSARTTKTSGKTPKPQQANTSIYEFIIINDLRCIRLKEDITAGELARKLQWSKKMLLYYNDFFEDVRLHAGDLIYLSKKRSRSAAESVTHHVKGGESMHSIAQQYGITLKSLYRINKLTYGAPAVEGMMLYLQ
jgi:LysM repeat protein